MFTPTPLAPLSSGVAPHPRQTAISQASGGRTKHHGKMIIAHFNPKELDELDHWQGKRVEESGTRMRTYAHLEELLKNPHILRSLFQHAQEMSREKPRHRAAGGPLHDYHDAKLNHMADQGIKGDTELGKIGPHTRNVFNALLEVSGHPPDRNPESKRPQYSYLEGVIGSLGKVLSPPALAGSVLGAPHMPQMSHGGMRPLGNQSQLGQIAGQYANKMFAGGASIQQVAPDQQTQKPPITSSLGQFGNQNTPHPTPQGNPQGFSGSSSTDTGNSTTSNGMNSMAPRGMPGQYLSQPMQPLSNPQQQTQMGQNNQDPNSQYLPQSYYQQMNSQ